MIPLLIKGARKISFLNYKKDKLLTKKKIFFIKIADKGGGQSIVDMLCISKSAR